jgi:hypothetical protein
MAAADCVVTTIAGLGDDEEVYGHKLAALGDVRFHAATSIIYDDHDDCYLIADGRAIRTLSSDFRTIITYMDHPRPVHNMALLPILDHYEMTDRLYYSTDHSIQFATAGACGLFSGESHGRSGYVDGSETEARFNCPLGIAFNSHRQLIVCDSLNYRMRLVERNGSVRTIAGTGKRGTDDGDALTEATFSKVRDVALDDADNAYITETGVFDRIRRLSNDGQVTSIAGYSPGRVDGVGMKARMNSLDGIVVDRKKGVLYVTAKHRIMRVSFDGSVTTIAGHGIPDHVQGNGYMDGTGTSSRFDTPTGLTLSADGWSLLVCDQNNHCIRHVQLVPVIDVHRELTAVQHFPSCLIPIILTYLFKDMPMDNNARKRKRKSTDSDSDEAVEAK